MAENFGQRLVYTVEGNAFLQHMVRRIVGMQLDVARGQMSQTAFETAFRARDLAQAGTLAPPQGLVLAEVRY
jgi:tRNA pseudouridine38-40 synthase